MRVQRIWVQRFKSLYDIAVSPTNLTVLFGPNNSGKTNLAEAIDFVSEVHRFGLELAVQRRGGFEAMAFRRMRRTKEPITFRVLGRLGSREVGRIIRERLGRPDADAKPSRDVPLFIDYTFALKATSETVETDYSIATEHLLPERWTPSRSTERFLHRTPSLPRTRALAKSISDYLDGLLAPGSGTMLSTRPSRH